MNKTINVGLIGGGLFETAFKTEQPGKFNLTKIFAADNVAAVTAKSIYPQAEIVDDIKAIVNDAAIELVIITTPNAKASGLVQDVLQSGKQVRII